MKRLNPILILLTTFLLVAFVTTLSAQSHKGFAVKKNIPQHKMDKGLNLSDEQKSKMADLRLALQKETLPLQTELHAKITEIRLLKTEDNPNINKIDHSIEQSEKIRTKIQKTKARHQLEVRKILTPDQKKIWDSRTLQGRGHRMMGRNFREAPDQF